MAVTSPAGGRRSIWAGQQHSSPRRLSRWRPCTVSSPRLETLSVVVSRRPCPRTAPYSTLARYRRGRPTASCSRGPRKPDRAGPCSPLGRAPCRRAGARAGRVVGSSPAGGRASGLRVGLSRSPGPNARCAPPRPDACESVNGHPPHRGHRKIPHPLCESIIDTRCLWTLVGRPSPGWTCPGPLGGDEGLGVRLSVRLSTGSCGFRETAFHPMNTGCLRHGSLPRCPTGHSASGCGRSWKWMIELRMPFPPSMCQFRFDP